PSSVVISVDGGTPFTNSGFDTSQNIYNYGDARVLAIDLTGYAGRYVQMDFYNPVTAGAPGGEWTSLNEVMFYGSTATNVPPVIVQNPTPTNLVLQAGQSATFQALASGTAPLSYLWRKGTTPITGATGASYTIPTALTSDTGSYAVVVTNNFGSVTSAVANLTVILGQPFITNQPVGFTLEQGYSRVLSGVAAAGAQPISYQWTRDGTPINGATNSTYAVLHALSTANYRVILTNSVGSATSAVATVTVIPTNTITGISYTYSSGTLAGYPFETTNHSILSDGYATIQADVDAAAGHPPGYYVNGTAPFPQWGFLTGPGSAPVGTIPQPGIRFDLGVAQELTQVKVFYVDKYTDGVSAPSSVVISIDAGNPFTNTGFDTSQSVDPYGDARALTIDLTGHTGRYVQMDFYNPENNGYPGGQWTALSETMFYGNVATNWNVSPVIVQDTTPTSLEIYASQSATFRAVVSGTEPLHYQWWKNGVTPVPGATAASYTIMNAQVGDSGSYALVVTNTFGSVTSAVATLTVTLGLPFFTNEPVGFSLEQGYSRVMSGVGVGGLQPITYQWTQDGTPIAGATNASYAVLHAQNTANYRVILTNSFGSATSDVATVTVIATNTITGVSYAYTSGTLAGAGGTFESTNHSILSDGFATTQDDVDAAAGNPWGYYVNGNSPQLGFIIGPGSAPVGTIPQPGIRFDLGAAQNLTQVTIFYVDRYGHGVSAPSSVVISVDAGTPFTKTGFDTSQNVDTYGDARALTIDLTGYTGRYVQMDVYNPENYGYPGGQWTALSEVMFYGSTAGNELSFTTSGGQLTLSWTGTGYHAQANPVVNNAGCWTNVPGGNLSPLIVPIAPTGNLFYRLIKP
ncbi:MAG: hypothetical protein NT154_16955, partial [Verrucomicrobia bacterium]|nr:hypothetical protein [Verrucomicrobiota bacterium]